MYHCPGFAALLYQPSLDVKITKQFAWENAYQPADYQKTGYDIWHAQSGKPKNNVLVTKGKARDKDLELSRFVDMLSDTWVTY